MKKWFILLVAVLGFSSFASAQSFSIKAGVAYNFSGGIGVNLGVVTGNLVKFSSDSGIGLRSDFKSDFSAGFSGLVSISPVFNLALGGKDYLYFGPSVGLVFGAGTSVFIFGIDIGDFMYLTNTLAWYANVKLLFVPSFLIVSNLGISYDLSKSLALYFEVLGASSTGGTFDLGISLGANFKL